MSDLLESYVIDTAEIIYVPTASDIYNVYRLRNKRKSGARRMQQRRRSLLERDGSLCHYCQTEMVVPRGHGHHPREMTIEHVVPQKDGGSSSMFNVVLACNTCNNNFGSLYLKCECNFCSHARAMRKVSHGCSI